MGALLGFPQRHHQALHPTAFDTLTRRCSEIGVVVEREPCGAAEGYAITVSNRRVVFAQAETLLAWVAKRRELATSA